MDKIENKLKRITSFWNNYVWKNSIIQKEVKWDSEVKTNYYGDILCYLNDTFDLIARKPENGDYKDSIFYMTGLLQVMYVHQDLMDEILKIFKLSVTTKGDKKPIRDIRNELVGHPISRTRDNVLKSSVFFGNNLSPETLHYIKYDKKNKYNTEEKTFSVEKLKQMHKDYLNKHFDRILEKIAVILDDYSKKLYEIESVLEEDIDFNKLVDLTFEYYVLISDFDYLYQEDILKECYQRKDEHIRYKNVVHVFKKELREMLADTRESMNEIISEKASKKFVTNKPIEPINIVFFDPNDEKPIERPKQPENYNYALGKLHDKRHHIGTDYFRRAFPDNTEINVELDNMDENFNSNLEYYSSYELLSNLINESLKLSDAEKIN